MLNGSISIKARIGLAMAFLAALLIATGTFGLVGMGRTNNAYRETVNTQMTAATDIDNAEIYAARARMALDRAAFMIGTPEATKTAARAQMLYDTSHAWWNRYLTLPRNADEDRLAQDVKGKRDAYRIALDEFAKLVATENRAEVANGANRLQVAYSALSSVDDALRKYQSDQARLGFDNAQLSFSELRIVTIIALVAGLLAALGSYFSLRRSIGSPLTEALGHFEAIASGDLGRQVNVRSRDEMGQLLKGVANMQKSLIHTVRSVRSGSESIATATRQIAAGNIDLSSRTEEQASALQETATSMDHLTGTVKNNAENARQASQLAADASEIATRGNAVVCEVVSTMGDINQSSAKIANIIAIIEGIAFQTNILALNAAVEAARAGEEGRGFAVVAGEVRSLAQRSAAAAKEIKELIETSVERVQSGSVLVDEAGRTMSEIIGAIRRVTDIMGEIAVASEEQSSGIDQIARAVTQMDEVTQQNAALVEQAAAAAQSLQDQAQALNRAVSIFSTDEHLTQELNVAAASTAATALRNRKERLSGANT
jgi:methyl-accepting chemotaxis protein-1 (serine sensor receptor)